MTKTLFLYLFILSLQLNAQLECSFIFYNCENAFDTLETSIENPDLSFTPKGNKKWNSWKYWRKISNLSRVINHSIQEETIAIGLAEIETRAVLADILSVSGLKDQGFEIIQFNSPDKRGIDVALLVNTLKCTILSTEVIREEAFKTRDVLQVRIEYAGVEIELLVAHFPSKRGGELKSEGRRIQISNNILNRTVQENQVSIIMGDFNANPFSPCMQLLQKNGYRWLKPTQGKGTHTFQGHWDFLDCWYIRGRDFNYKSEILTMPFLFDQHQNPRRTFLGPHYIGGYSDHLPIRLSLTID